MTRTASKPLRGTGPTHDVGLPGRSNSQLCCPLFQAAWHKMKTKCHLWEELRHHFRLLLFGSMAELLTALIRGIAPQNPIFGDTSSWGRDA